MDIVERLRGLPIVVTENGRTGISRMGGALLSEAADYIEQLEKGNRLHLELAEIKEAEIERLREALQSIQSLATPPVRQRSLRNILKECVWFAETALKEKE